METDLQGPCTALVCPRESLPSSAGTTPPYTRFTHLLTLDRGAHKLYFPHFSNNRLKLESLAFLAKPTKIVRQS